MMPARTRLSASFTAVAAILALAAPLASADTITLTPASADFGSQPVGSISPVKDFMLEMTCTRAVIECTGSPTSFSPAISTTGPFSQTNDCPATLNAFAFVTTRCTIHVAFAPIAPGGAAGIVRASGPAMVNGGAAVATERTASLAGIGTGASGTKKKCKKAKKKAVGTAKRKGCKKKKKK